MDKKYYDKESDNEPCPHVIKIIGDDPGEYRCVLVKGHKEMDRPHNLVFYRDVRRNGG